MAPARGSWIICSLYDLFFRSKFWSSHPWLLCFSPTSHPSLSAASPPALCSQLVCASSLSLCSSLPIVRTLHPDLNAAAGVIPLHCNSDHSSPVLRALCGFPLQSPKKPEIRILQGPSWSDPQLPLGHHLFFYFPITFLLALAFPCLRPMALTVRSCHVCCLAVPLTLQHSLRTFAFAVPAPWNAVSLDTWATGFLLPLGLFCKKIFFFCQWGLLWSFFLNFPCILMFHFALTAI